MDFQAVGFVTPIAIITHEPTCSFFPTFILRENEKNEKATHIYLPGFICFSVLFSILYYGKFGGHDHCKWKNPDR